MTRFLDRPAEAAATYGLAAYILCLPLEFTSVYLKQQLSRFVLVIVAAAFLYLLATQRGRLVVPRTLSVGLLVLYIAASLIGWLMTRSPGSINAVVDLTLYPVVALLIVNLADSEADHRRAWTAFLVSALAVGVLGVFLYLTHLSIWTPNPLVAARMNITFGDPNITARFLTLGVTAAVLLFAARRSQPVLAVATAVICGAMIPLTLSRSGLILFIAAVAFAVIVAFDRRRALAIGLTALAIFAASTAINPPTRLRAEVTAETVLSFLPPIPLSHSGPAVPPPQNKYAIEDNRTYLIAAGLQMFRDHKIIGVGFGGYQHAITTTYRSYLPTNRNAANLDTLSHAAIVTVMAEQGVVGTILLLAFFVALGLELWRARQLHGPWALWATVPGALIVSILVYSNIEGRLITEPYLWVSLGLAYAALMRTREAVHLTELKSERPESGEQSRRPQVA
jgi:O-antigen ligase